jgi:DNA-binding NarL/FixJ family response regulator
MCEGGLMVADWSTVLLADSHSPMLEALRTLLEQRFEAVVMVADESSLLRAIEKLQAVCVIVDLSFACTANQQGGNIVSVLHARADNLKLIVLSVHDEQSVAQRALELGADGFVVKGWAVVELLPAIDAVMAGDNYMSPHVCVS